MGKEFEQILFQKKIYEYPISTRKDAQLHESWRNVRQNYRNINCRTAVINNIEFPGGAVC